MLKNIMYVGILRSGETRSEIFPELQIVPLDLYERAQELMEAVRGLNVEQLDSLISIAKNLKR